QHRERAYQRDGHVDHRQDHGPPVLQKEQDHQGDQQDSDQQGIKNLIDRLLNEGSGVVDDVVFESGGKAGFELLHFGFDQIGDFEGVGAGKQEDGQAGRGLAVELVALIIVLRFQLNLANVEDVDDGDG